MKRYAVFEIYRGPDFTLLEIAALALEVDVGRMGRLARARVEPTALIVCGDGEVRAYGMDAKPAELEALRRLAPELDARLSAIAG